MAGLSRMVQVLLDASTAPVASVGSKAAGLARLAAAGCPVPAFLVVSSKDFAAHLHRNRITWPPTTTDGWRAVRDRIRTAPLEPALSGQIVDGYDALGRVSGHGRVAIRSSGTEEDSPSASFAGQFDSFLNVSRSGLLDAVKGCWASSLSDRSLDYRAVHGLPLGPDPGFAVILQTQVLCERAGVLFTVHPMDPELETAYIEANFGTGESVVGGLATPDHATISRSDGRIAEMFTATKRRMTALARDADGDGTQVLEIKPSQQNAPVLTQIQVQEIFQMGMRIEQLAGTPQDIEWAYDSDQLWILQARPITGPGGEGA